MRIITVLLAMLFSTLALAADDPTMVDVKVTPKVCEHMGIYVSSAVVKIQQGYTDERIQDEMIVIKSNPRISSEEYIANYVVYMTIASIRQNIIDPVILQRANRTYPVSLSNTIRQFEYDDCMGRIGKVIKVPQRRIPGREA